MVTVIYEGRQPVAVACDELSTHVWLTPSELLNVTGWDLKPEGLCRGEVCVPLPKDGSWLDDRGRVDLRAFAQREGRAIVIDEGRGVCAISVPRLAATVSVEAPDFTFHDLDGNRHSLSDYRGQKVFLYTWGSYCGCSFDPPVWETLYDELRDQNFEMISIALDAAGSPAVEDRIRPANLDERPEEIRRLRGWSEERWAAKQAPSHPCLIDENHELAVTYGITNVPMAVWVDENGRMVRPPEPAGVTDHFRSMDPETFELPEHDARTLVANRERYIDALRDWVKNGADSPYALTEDEVLARLHAPSEEELTAALHVRIGHYLYEAGDVEGATAHVATASQLVPDSWVYRRQAMVLDPELVGALNVQPGFWEAMDALGDSPFYAEIDMPGIAGNDTWMPAGRA